MPPGPPLCSFPGFFYTPDRIRGVRVIRCAFEVVARCPCLLLGKHEMLRPTIGELHCPNLKALNSAFVQRDGASRTCSRFVFSEFQAAIREINVLPFQAANGIEPCSG